MIPQKTVEDLIDRHSQLEKDLSSGKIEKSLFAIKSKEYSDLNEIILIAKKYLSYEKNKKELQKIIDDKNSESEIKNLATLELEELKFDFEKN